MEKPRVSDAVQIEELGSEIVVCHPGQSRVFHLNDLASLILYHCDGSRSPDEIVREVGGLVRGAEAGTIEQDVLRTLETLKQEKILVDA
jgi:hypothetical protein